jgi:hypothetical protein
MAAVAKEEIARATPEMRTHDQQSETLLVGCGAAKPISQRHDSGKSGQWVEVG